MGALLHDAGEVVTEAFFPCGNALASFAVEARAGGHVEAALIGSEGAVGGIVSPGRLPAFSRAEVQLGGRFLSLPLEVLHDEENRSPELRHWLARYGDCLFAQVLQSAACNAVHSIEQRAAKWLIAAVERSERTVLPITQDKLADMLGVGRSFVNRVLKRFRAAGLVESRRGALVVHDVAGLKALACDCDDRVKAHFDGVMGAGFS
jgi:DNA-binding transcriptional ArsR family regulator